MSKPGQALYILKREVSFYIPFVLSYNIYFFHAGTPPTKRRRIETPNDQRFEDQSGHPFKEPDAARVEPGDVEMNYGDAFDAYREHL